MPHFWKLGSDIEAHVHYLQSDATQTDNWYLYYRIQPVGSAITGTWSDAGIGSNVITYSSGVIHQMWDFPSIDMSSVSGVSCIVDWRIARDGDSDTYNGNMYLMEFDIHYEVDSLGSDTEYTK